MATEKRVLGILGLLILLIACRRNTGNHHVPEIGTFDILLDYDQVNKTDLAQVYRNSMELFEEYDITEDRIYERTDTLDGKVIHFFGIRHQSRLAIIRFMRNVLPFIKDGADWYFLIEGSEEEVPLLPEVFFFKGVANELGIELYDPVVSPLGEEVTRSLVLGTPPMVTLKDIHFAVFNDYFPTQQALDILSPSAKVRFKSVIASYSVLPEDSISRLLDEYDSLFLSRPVKLRSAKPVFSQIREDMIDTSNALTRKKLENNIEDISHARHIFICVGAYHQPAFDSIENLFGTVYELHTSTQEEPSTR